MANKEEFNELTVFSLKQGVTNFTESDVRYYRTVKGITSDVVLVQFADGKTDLYDAR